jgi:uncharacterized repeat protein (TIGR01451 family)
LRANENRAFPHAQRLHGAVTALICATIALAAGAPSANAQGSIPDIRGVYQVTVAYSNCGGDGTNQFQSTLNITTQVNGNFSGQNILGLLIFCTGSVDAGGRLQGTYQRGVATHGGYGKFTGQFDGTAVPKTILLNLTGTHYYVGQPGPCPETITIQGTMLAAGGPSADLSITGAASPTPVATGNSITYSLAVANAGPNDATGTIAVNPAPPGTSIVAAMSSQGQCDTTVLDGQLRLSLSGSAVCSLGTIPSGGAATITITANLVSVAPGSVIVDSPSVSSSNVFDPNLSNNSASISTPVVGGALIKLVWDEPTPAASNPTPAPQNLRVELAGSPSATLAGSALQSYACPACRSQRVVPQDTCTLITINIYKSDSPPVVPIPANLWAVVPPDNLQATLASAPGGSFYVITNVWNCGGTIIESGVSNQASVPAGPTVTSLKVTGKLKGLGSNFADGVQVFVNGVGFVKQTVFADSTMVIQKGLMTDGTAITDVGTNGTVLVTFKNPDGGLGSITFKR